MPGTVAEMITERLADAGRRLVEVAEPAAQPWWLAAADDSSQHCPWEQQQQQQRSRQPLAAVGQPGGAAKPLDRAHARGQGARDACCRCPGLWRRAWSRSAAMRWPRAHAASATNARDQIQRHRRSNARRTAWPRAAACRRLRWRPAPLRIPWALARLLAAAARRSEPVAAPSPGGRPESGLTEGHFDPGQTPFTSTVVL
jgi:hypothetical protein